MRILHIDLGRELRGGQHQVILLMEGLSRHGHTSVLFARGKSPLAAEGSKRGFEVRTSYAKNFLQAVRKADLTHAHDAAAHSVAVAGFARKPILVSRRVAFPIGTGFASRWKYSRTSRYIAVSNAVAAELRRAGIPTHKIDVVYDAVPDVEALTTWNRSGPVVALASKDPQKGRDLVEAAAGRSGVPVIYSDNVVRDLRSASMFVYISRSEGLGSAALIAMAIGVPVIASRVGGLPEALDNGRCGVLVNNDAAEIASAIESLYRDPITAHELIFRAHQHIDAHFTQERMVNDTLATYERALAA